MELGNGRTRIGRIVGDPASGFRFQPEGGGEAIPLETISLVTFEGASPDPAAARPPFHALLGLGQRLSGRLVRVDPDEIRLEEGPGGKAVTLARGGVHALIQRPGEAQVLSEGFETLANDRWVRLGEPELVGEPKREGRMSLKLPAGGTSLTYSLVEPVGSGRLEIAFYDSGARAEGQRWFVDLTFRGSAAEHETIRAVLGWSEETLAVESPGGPALGIQPLARKPGWHRLVVRFDPKRTDLIVDGNELAHGQGPGGPLVEIRLASQTSGQSPAPEGLAAYLDDLRLSRRVEPVGRMEVDPAQDEVRLVSGDQIFGQIQAADPEHIILKMAGRSVTLGWAEVSGLYFRRAPAVSAPVEGLLVRADWRSAPGAEDRATDSIEGALIAASDAAFLLATPYAGTLTIPRDRMSRLQVLGRALRIIIDPTAHHLGDRDVPDLDPPHAEGTTLEIPFVLDQVPAGEATLALDVVQVVGESGNPDFSDLVKDGQLRTVVRLNGQVLDAINRYIHDKNETPERIRLPIPAGLLKPGRNHLRFEQTPTKETTERFDNLGLLGTALEFARGPDPEAPRP
ncbi:MAG: hypothetical protein IRY99_12240 [Isosphaeraceae bacterium]|nr:hypothetical protein [Isosphaeraceae bacterium]